MSSGLKTFVFAGVLCLVCSVLLTTASTGLKSIQLRNVAVDRQKNILKSLGLVKEEQRYSPAEIETLYQENVKNLWVDSTGALVPESDRGDQDLPLYAYLADNQIQAYAVPINTRGLWGKIFGYLALESDGTTIRGFTVYKHSETPGLGGEIEKRWFQKNFEGKKIINREGEFVAIAVAKGDVRQMIPAPDQVNYVDGISGATLTGRFLSSGFKEILRDYEPVAIQFRTKNYREQ